MNYEYQVKNMEDDYCPICDAEGRLLEDCEHEKQEMFEFNCIRFGYDEVEDQLDRIEREEYIGRDEP